MLAKDRENRVISTRLVKTNGREREGGGGSGEGGAEARDERGAEDDQGLV